ncbi:MAG: TOBE domain-containing protein [Candidatus Acidiferrales bacterium]
MKRRAPSPPLMTPRQAARTLGISYPTVKLWIYKGKLRTVKTAGGHHRIPETEIERYLPRAEGTPAAKRGLRRISGRNQLAGHIVDVRVSGLLAQVTLSIGGQQITSVITSDAARDMRLAPGQRAAALIKSTEVMIIRL